VKINTSDDPYLIRYQNKTINFFDLADCRTHQQVASQHPEI